jgi:hypothetical protein
MTNLLNRVKRASKVNYADEVVEGGKAGMKRKVMVREVGSNKGFRKISVDQDVTRGWNLGMPTLSVEVLVWVVTDLVGSECRDCAFDTTDFASPQRFMGISRWDK